MTTNQTPLLSQVLGKVEEQRLTHLLNIVERVGLVTFSDAGRVCIDDTYTYGIDLVLRGVAPAGSLGIRHQPKYMLVITHPLMESSGINLQADPLPVSEWLAMDTEELVLLIATGIEEVRQLLRTWGLDRPPAGAVTRPEELLTIPVTVVEYHLLRRESPVTVRVSSYLKPGALLFVTDGDPDGDAAYSRTTVECLYTVARETSRTVSGDVENVPPWTPYESVLYMTEKAADRGKKWNKLVE